MGPHRALPFGDDAIAVACAGPDEARALATAIASVPGVLEAVAGYERVVAHLDGTVARGDVLAALDDLSAPPLAEATTRRHLVRVVYDGPDLRAVADALELSPAEVAERHAARDLVVEVIGFLPGFAYLGGLDPSLARPRLATPRPRVAAGSVAIAGERSAIYPLASPGGWNLLGKVVDFLPFTATRSPPCVFALGDHVRFVVEDVRC